MAGVIMDSISTDAQPSPAHSVSDGQNANRRSPALVETSDVSVKTDGSTQHPSTSTPSHVSRSSPSKLLLPVLSEATPDPKASSHAGSTFATIESEHRLSSPIQFPPRSAAISSRRGRSRSPTSRSPSSMSMHSSSSPTMGLMMHKGDGEAMGNNMRSEDRRIAKKDSRDDGATTITSPGTEPVNMSSAAAAAAAAAASFSVTKQRGNIPASSEGEIMNDSLPSMYPSPRNQQWPSESQSKRSREYDATDAYSRKSSRGSHGGEDGTKSGGGMRGSSNRFSASSRGRPMYRQSQHNPGGGGRNNEHSSWNIDDPNSPSNYGSGNQPYSHHNTDPFHEDRGRFSPVPGASAVTSSSSTSLTPEKAETNKSARGNMVLRVQGTESSMPPQMLHSLDTPPTSFDDKPKDGETLSPMDPPQIKHSHHQQQIFTPKTFFDEGAAGSDGGDKNTFSPIDHKNGTASNPNIEMAGSFNLFNHSFDSLGGMPELDVGINSFGIVNSAEGPSMSFPQQQDRSPRAQTKTKNETHPGQSGQEKFNQAPILNGSSSGGSMKMFGGISPSNTFDAAINVGDTAAIADIVLNNTNILSELSPSASYQKDNSDRSHQPYSRYNDQQSGRSPPRRPGHTNQIIGPSDGHQNFPPPGIPPQGPPSFYVVLRRWRNAFAKFTFVLPGLKVRETCSVNVSAVGNITVYSGPGQNRKDNNFGGNGGPSGPKGRESQKAAFMPEPSAPSRPKKFPDPNSSEIAIATRRVTSAVCAFGGSCQQASRPSTSIFRTKYGGNGHSTFIKSESQIKYEEQLPNRYYENDNRLSWEVEERPPVEVITDDEDVDGSRKDGTDRKSGKKNKSGKDESGRSSSSLGMKSEFPSTSPSPAHSSSSEQPKMKYRCKLCGLPKQNHTCPYQQSLQRSIGIMVYPAVNAHIANEPGRLAPVLTDMNNFMGGDDSGSSNDNSPPRLKLDDASTATSGSLRTSLQHTGSPHNVTPESMRSSVHMPRSPGSSISGTPDRSSTPFRRMGRGQSHYTPQRPMRRGDFSSMSGFGTELSADPLFVDTMEIKQEQYRIVSASKQTTSKGAYSFASLPLPYGQRKRLSDSLFAMSKEIPGLTDECAIALREARQKGKWDLAVAELMTQVVIIMHCREGDNTLEGLRRYLLTLGIAC